MTVGPPAGRPDQYGMTVERHVKYPGADLEPVNLRCGPEHDMEDIPGARGEPVRLVAARLAIADCAQVAALDRGGRAEEQDQISGTQRDLVGGEGDIARAALGDREDPDVGMHSANLPDRRAVQPGAWPDLDLLQPPPGGGSRRGS
jgi:hypothetical protein